MLSRAARRLARGDSARLAAAAVARARGLAERGNLELAAQELELAADVEPRSASNWRRLAGLRFELGEVDRAIVAYRRALELEPGMPQVRSNLLFALAHRVDDPAALLAEHLAWAALVSADGSPSSPGLRNDRDPERPLRVAYLSSDFRGHAISLFVEPLLARHDPARVNVYCYDNAPAADEVARRLRSHGGVWRDARALDGTGFREQVLADRIDILVDLSGHTAGNRLADLARRVAPVQAAYLGYHGTTGLATMDYRITDSFADPPGATEAYYVEQLARMPHCLWCYRPALHEPERLRAVPPAGDVIFASLNNLRKVATPVVALWARLLLAVPASRLVIAGAADGPASRDVLARLTGHGVDPARIERIGWLEPAAFAALHARIDVALDTYPFNGGTTTIEALARGVPVVSWSGRTAASCCGRTILSTIGLPELLADSAERYVEIAADLARDRDRLAALKSDLPARVQRSAIMDEARFVADLEDLYRRMWRDWCEQPLDPRARA
jgi:protein O-GlcNAc transferase